MNIACPDCRTVYRVDPARVPHGGILTKCRACGTRFRVEPGETAPGEVRAGIAQAKPSPRPAESAPATSAPGAAAPAAAPARSRPATPVFGPQDPETRAKRLARALVSDIVVYNPDKWEQSREAGTLRKEFRDEILKSWEEYVEQVGEEMAKKTPYFRDALNSILAEGKRVF